MVWKSYILTSNDRSPNKEKNIPQIPNTTKQIILAHSKRVQILTVMIKFYINDKIQTIEYS
ncbi:MAG: hypothetical protein BZ136_05980 [Methanosphaera sp. rholeuAM74]|nr:MAG: hypothetical protein BZ136_05980 [Methanosphaera sp. rholeuAM74]